MKAGLNRIGRAGSARAGGMAFGPRGLLVSAALVIGFTIWLLMPASEGNVVQAAPAPQAEPVESTATSQARDAAELDRLRISSQSWRRGGLGSRALVSFTLRNDNEYAVKDVEIVCAFNRRDGSHLTDRRRVLPDTVNTKSRKTFARVQVGFVNVNANQAKCTVAAARRA